MENYILQSQVEFDFLDRKTINSIQSRMLTRVLDAARHNPLYPELCNDPSKITHESAVHILRKLPYSLPVDHRGYLGDTAAATIVLSSSGSTSALKIVGLRFDEVLRNARFHGKGYLAAGIRPWDRVITFGHAGLMNSECTVYLGLATTGCLTIPVGIVDAASTIVDLCDELRATVLLVMPSDLSPILKELDRSKRRLPHLRLVVTGGEPTSETIVQRAQNVCGDGMVQFRSTFQTSQAGTIGFQCEHLKSNEYHVHEELQLVEIDAATRELVTTNLDRIYMPVVRMKTGDLAEFTYQACPCGRSLLTLRLLGRKLDLVKIGGELFDPILFELIADTIGLYRNTWQVQLSRTQDGRDLLVAYLDANVKSLGSRRFWSLVVERSQTLARQIHAGVVAEPECRNLDDSNHLLTGTGKHIQFVDLRSKP
jgi:phenylacetate-CoA ligase